MTINIVFDSRVTAYSSKYTIQPEHINFVRYIRQFILFYVIRRIWYTKKKKKEVEKEIENSGIGRVNVRNADSINFSNICLFSRDGEIGDEADAASLAE